MSERKSWDIQPKRRRAARVSVPTHTPQIERVREAGKSAPSFSTRRERVPSKKSRGFFGRKTPKAPRLPKASNQSRRPVTKLQHREVIEVATKPGSMRRDAIPQGRNREPLKERRKRARRRATWIISILFVLLVIGTIAAFWLPVVRIQHVEAAGPDTSVMQSIVSAQLLGTYDYLFPRNSIFFFPEDTIRQQILSQNPDISAVSISRSSFNSIGIISIPREAVLTWCGSTYTPGSAGALAGMAVKAADSSSTTDATDTPLAQTDFANGNQDPSSTPVCYSADANGILFAPITEAVTPSTENLILYGPLQSPLSGTASSSPLGSVIAEANMIPNALQFVKAMRSLGAPIVTLVLRGDEADLYTLEGTRITYVLGQEHDAAQLAESAFPSLDVSDGSLEYIDLRFQGKVYFKKAGATSESSTTPPSQ